MCRIKPSVRSPRADGKDSSELSSSKTSIAFKFHHMNPLQGVLDRFEHGLSRSIPAMLEGRLSPLETAEMHFSVAQALHSLMCLYYKCHGIDPSEHSSIKQIGEKLKRYRKTMRKLLAHTKIKGKTSKDDLGVDVSSLNRYIDNAAGGEHVTLEPEYPTDGGEGKPSSGGTVRKRDPALGFLQDAMAVATHKKAKIL